MVAVLDDAWARIQSLEPGVPDASWYLTAGRSSSCATGPWTTPDNLVLRINLKRFIYGRDGKPELDEDGRPLLGNRDGKDILGQLLHWAAHAATGRSPGGEGRYHSREFGEVAERLGLQIKLDGSGYVPVRAEGHHPADALSLTALNQFRGEIRAIDKAMREWEPVAEDATRKRPRGPLAMACSCVPPRLIRATSGVALGPDITCAACGKPYRIVPGQRVSEADRV